VWSAHAPAGQHAYESLPPDAANRVKPLPASRVRPRSLPPALHPGNDPVVSAQDNRGKSFIAFAEQPHAGRRRRRRPSVAARNDDLDTRPASRWFSGFLFCNIRWPRSLGARGLPLCVTVAASHMRHHVFLDLGFSCTGYFVLPHITNPVSETPLSTRISRRG